MGLYSDVRVFFFAISSFLFGWCLASLNTLQKHVVILFEWCGDSHTFLCEDATNAFSVAMTVLLFGAAVGSILGGFVVPYGRRSGLMITHFVYLVGGLLSTFGSYVYIFYSGRFMLGLGLGFTVVVVPIFISEISAVSVRGSRGVVHQLMITLGILGGIASGFAVSPIGASLPDDYVLASNDINAMRIILAVPSMLSALSLLLLFVFFTEETPAYNVMRDSPAVAARILQKIYGKQDVEEELKAIVVANEEAKYAKNEGTAGWSQLLSLKYLWVTVFAIVLSLGQQLTGINVFVGMSSRFFEEAGLPDAYVTSASTGMAILNTLVTVLALFVVDRVGRKTLLAYSVVAMTCFLGIYPIVYCIPSLESVRGYVAVVSVLGFVVCFAIGYGPLLWLYMPEIFPVEIRSYGASLASAANWIGAIGIVYFGAQVESDFVKFTTFASFGLFFSLWIILFMRETRGTTTSPYAPRKAMAEDMYDSDRTTLLSAA